MGNEHASGVDDIFELGLLLEAVVIILAIDVAVLGGPDEL
jgi:hypothetical protein